MKIVNKVLEQNQAFQNKLKPRIMLMSADKSKASSDNAFVPVGQYQRYQQDSFIEPKALYSSTFKP